MSRRSLLNTENRKVGKPKYQPLVSYVSERPSSEVDRQPALTPAQEDTQSQDGTSLSNTRERYQPPRHAEVRESLNKLTSYMEMGGVEKTFLSLNKRLLSLSNLPYNPYPGFVRRIREWAEGFHMFEEPKQNSLKKLANPTKATRISSVVTSESRDGVWGVAGLVGAVDPGVGQLYRWLISSLTPPNHTLVVDEDRDYSNQVMPALLGSCAFHHTFYLHPQEVTVRVEYLIAGTVQDTAVQLFAESVTNDVVHMDQSPDHVVLGCTLPADVGSITLKNWTATAVSEERELFVKVVVAETLKKGKIMIEGIFRMDEHSDSYNWGSKHYVLNFLKVKEGTGEEEGVTAFTDLPLMTLHEGVFLNFLHVDSYMAAFAKMMEEDESDKRNRSRNPAKSFTNSHVQTDGFRLGSKIHLDPFSPKIIKPIKEELQRRVVSLHPQSQLFDTVPSLLLLCFIDKVTYGEELLLNLYRVQRSTASRLHRLQKMNTGLRAVINKFRKTGYSDVVTRMFTQYRKGISDLFSETLQQRSCDLVEAGKILLSRLDHLVQPDTNNVLLNGQTLLELQRLHGYCMPLQLHLTEDALSHSPKLKETLSSLVKTHPNHVPRPKTPTRQRRKQQQPKASNKKKFFQGKQEEKEQPLRAAQGVDTFIHGVEDENIAKHDKQAIDVKKNKQKESAPQSVAMESVLLRYIVDTRQDEVWPEYLIDLLSDSTLTLNPYPRLISALRHAAASMDVCQENPQKLLKRLLHGAARVEDAQSHVYYLPGADAHGCKSALALVDSSVFFKLASACQPFILQDFIQRKGPYRVAMCCSLGGHTPLFGRLMPYLLQIDLEEHCYIRGPDGGAQEAVQIYAKIVYEHVLSLRQKREHPVLGLYITGKVPIQVTEQDKRVIIEQLIQALTDRQPIHVKMYTLMDWRYVPIKKHFRFHYINVEETDFQEFFPTDASSYYKLVFFEGEKAAFHYQYGGPAQRDDPYSMGNVRTACAALQRRVLIAKDRHDWLILHRELLTRNLITQGCSHVGETWRMLHSVAGQFEYLVTLTASLIDLIWYAKGETPDKEKDSTKLGGLDVKALGRMTSAYRHKVEQVCRMQVAMTAAHLPEVLRVKVQQVTERQEDTRDLYLNLTSKTIEALEEVMGTLECLRDVTSYDVHELCPEAKAMVRAIEGEAGRPSSAGH